MASINCQFKKKKKRVSTDSLRMAEAFDNFFELDFKKSELFIR